MSTVNAYAERMLLFVDRMRAEGKWDFAVTSRGPIGAIDFEIIMTPAAEGGATITWFQMHDTFVVSVSRCEWQSQDYVLEHADPDQFLEHSYAWSCDLVWRIAAHGASFMRIKAKYPRVFRETRAVVGDEVSQRPSDALESWRRW